MDAGGEIRAELGGRPDLIIGNYSDGNLVASLLSFHLNVTQCTIAHALEKTKYPDADVNWCAPEKAVCTTGRTPLASYVFVEPPMRGSCAGTGVLHIFHASLLSR